MGRGAQERTLTLDRGQKGPLGGDGAHAKTWRRNGGASRRGKWGRRLLLAAATRHLQRSGREGEPGPLEVAGSAAWLGLGCEGGMGGGKVEKYGQGSSRVRPQGMRLVCAGWASP